MPPRAPAADEFALIDRILARLGDAAARDILVPPGDDAAAWTGPAGAIVASVDAYTEGHHWRPDTMSYADVGWRVAACTVSDLAAMGAHADTLLVAAVLGPALTLADLDAVIDGLAASCRHHGVRVAGGDVVRGAQTAFCATGIGSARLDRAGRALVLRRDAAARGDIVAVSGHPGAASAGLALIEAQHHDPRAAPLLRAHRRPEARLELGRAALAGGVRAAIDISDGLLQDLGHLARRSGVGIELDLAALPLHPAAVELFGLAAARDFALAGGDDYELALAGRAEALATLGVTPIGRIVDEHPGTVVAREPSGAPYAPRTPGWDPLRDRPLAEP
jgi:thiamine-monophosphate kinase